MPVPVSNLQEKVLVDDDIINLLDRVINKALIQEGITPDAEVSLVFVDDEYINTLNKQYRNIDRPTDVLSFAMMEGPDMPGSDEYAPMLGDVVISLETALRQAEEYGHSFSREIAYLTVHGVLHLLGYDHESDADKNIMREKEETILSMVLP